MLKFVNLISGSGSTNLSILKAESNGGELHGITETIAIISSSPDAAGIQKAINSGFAEKDILTVDSRKGDLANQLLEIFDHYQPDYFHQLGWMPRTPPEVLQHYQGLNQHLGPGGRWMYGVRRVYAHMRFCEMIGEERPIAVFCQYVDSEYDEGHTVYVEFADIDFGKEPSQIADDLLLVEHGVQIMGRVCIAADNFKVELVPNVAFNQEEEELLFKAKKEARDKYPPD